MGLVTAYVAELKKGGRPDACLTRAAVFTQAQIPLAMLDRLISMDSAFNTRFYQSLSLVFEAHGVAFSKSLQDAINSLGEGRFKSMGVLTAIDLVAFDLCRKVGLPARMIVMRSVATSAASTHIAERYQGVDACQARVAGMLRHVGLPIIAAVNGEKYKAVWEALAGGAASISEAEKYAFGYTHETVGGLVVQQWAMPPFIAEAMNPSKRPLAELTGVTYCVEAGSIMAHQLGFDGGAANTPPALPLSELARVGITENDLAKLADEVSAEVNLCSQMLSG
jgi:HD-like signal output (HDOD) protein